MLKKKLFRKLKSKDKPQKYIIIKVTILKLMSKKPTFEENWYKKFKKVVILITQSNGKIYKPILYYKVVNNITFGCF